MNLVRNPHIKANYLPSFTSCLEPEDLARFGFLIDFFSRWPLFQDGEDQRRSHGVLAELFTAARVERMQSLIETAVGETIRPLFEERGPWDAVSRFAKPLPLRVILAVLGFPADDAPDMLAWADAVEDWFGGRGPPAPRFIRCQAALQAFAARAEARLADPALPADGAAAALVRAAAAGRLDPRDVVPNIFFLMAAGHESSAGLLAHGLRTLLPHPRRAALTAALVAAPPSAAAHPSSPPADRDAGGLGGGDAGDDIVEELLRLVTPVARLYREVGPEGLDYAGLRFPSNCMLPQPTATRAAAPSRDLTRPRSTPEGRPASGTSPSAHTTSFRMFITSSRSCRTQCVISHMS